MSDIKSAREIAMEKVAQLGEVTDEERLRWRYVPEGEALASKYLKEDLNLTTELAGYGEEEGRYVREGAAGILIWNIGLPRSEAERKTNRRAMDGLKMVKLDKVAVENAFSRLRNIFKHYAEQGEQQRQQAYAQLKADFEGRVRQAMQQQLNPLLGTKIDVEKQPQFQEEWRRLQLQMDSQYNQLPGEYKAELAIIA